MTKREDELYTLGAIARQMGLNKRTVQHAAQMGYLWTTNIETPVGPLRMTTEQAVKEWLEGPKARPRKTGAKP